jgi:hypothetical protein
MKINDTSFGGFNRQNIHEDEVCFQQTFCILSWGARMPEICIKLSSSWLYVNLPYHAIWSGTKSQFSLQNSTVNKSTVAHVHRHDLFGSDFVDSLMKLLVLLTTANNPDGIDNLDYFIFSFYRESWQGFVWYRCLI